MKQIPLAGLSKPTFLRVLTDLWGLGKSPVPIFTSSEVIFCDAFIS